MVRYQGGKRASVSMDTWRMGGGRIMSCPMHHPPHPQHGLRIMSCPIHHPPHPPHGLRIMSCPVHHPPHPPPHTAYGSWLMQAAGSAIANACGAGGDQARVFSRAVAQAVATGGCTRAISQALAQAWATASANGQAFALASAMAKASVGAATCSIKSQFSGFPGFPAGGF